MRETNVCFVKDDELSIEMSTARCFCGYRIVTGCAADHRHSRKECLRIQQHLTFAAAFLLRFFAQLMQLANN